MYAAILAMLAVLAPAALASPIFLEQFSGFAGRGLAPGAPAGGRLDSNHWRIGGLSDGDSAFGDTRSSGDFARGLASGAVATGGLYAFAVGGGRALGLQPTGSDLTPGFVELRVGLPAAAAGGVLIDYTLAVLDDQPRSTRIGFAWSSGGAASAVPDATLITPLAAAAGDGWTLTTRRVVAPAAGDALTLRWTFEDAGGRGGRDQVGIDQVRLSPLDSPAAALAEPASGALALLGCAGLAGWRRLSRSRRRPGRSSASRTRTSTASR